MTTTETTLVLDETPVDYTDGDDRGIIAVRVEDGYDFADVFAYDAANKVNLRLDRNELAALIATAARAMALLS